jgi:hypothetical protein
MENLKEFKELILRYESITVEEIENHVSDGFVINSITGFGTHNSCTLCKPIKVNCYKCVYCKAFDSEVMDDKLLNYCCRGDAESTYDAIIEAEKPQELKVAFKARANYMRSILKNLKKES